MKELVISPAMFELLVDDLMKQLITRGRSPQWDRIYAVPRGGAPLGMALSQKLSIPLMNSTGESFSPRVLVVDDVIGTGVTRRKFPNNDFACLHCKFDPKLFEVWSEVTGETFISKRALSNEWIRYWWEPEDEKGPHDSVRRLLEFIGDDPNREGLKETPERVVRSFQELFSGYGTDPASIVKDFENPGYDQIVLQKDIEFWSMCEHHMLPFFGKASVAYLPHERIIGLSKLARLVEVFARRLQVQERLGEQIVNALMEHLKPLGAACRLSALHLCIACRGVNKQHSTTVTQSLKGIFLEDTPEGRAARQELSALFNGR